MKARSVEALKEELLNKCATASSTPGRLRRLFNMMDKSGDGEIDRVELFSIVSYLNLTEGFGHSGIDELVDDLLNEMDPSGDGKISFEEFSSALKLPAFPYFGPAGGVVTKAATTARRFGLLSEVPLEGFLVCKTCETLVPALEQAVALRSRHRFHDALAPALDLAQTVLRLVDDVVGNTTGPSGLFDGRVGHDEADGDAPSTKEVSEGLPLTKAEWAVWWDSIPAPAGSIALAGQTRRAALSAVAVQLQAVQQSLLLGLQTASLRCGEQRGRPSEEEEGRRRVAGCESFAPHPWSGPDDGGQGLFSPFAQAAHIMRGFETGHLRHMVVASGAFYMHRASGSSVFVSEKWLPLGYFSLRLARFQAPPADEGGAVAPGGGEAKVADDKLQFTLDDEEEVQFTLQMQQVADDKGNSTGVGSDEWGSLWRGTGPLDRNLGFISSLDGKAIAADDCDSAEVESLLNVSSHFNRPGHRGLLLYVLNPDTSTSSSNRVAIGFEAAGHVSCEVFEALLFFVQRTNAGQAASGKVKEAVLGDIQRRRAKF